MPDFFAHRFAHTNFAGPIHTLVQIGGQSMQDIEDALRIDPTQIVLTTMDPDLTQAADEALAPWRTTDKTARIEHVAITTKRIPAATTQVHLFRDPSLSTRKKPTGLQTLFPELTPKCQATVPCVTASGFLNALPAMPEGQRHMLRFGLTGDEHMLLNALGDKLAQRFHDIVVSLPPTPLFERAPAHDTLLERLHDLGFVPLAQREGPLRGIPECHLIRSPHHTALQSSLATDMDRQRQDAEQKARIQSLKRENDKLRKALDQNTLDARDLKELRARHADVLADYDTQSETLREVQARVKAALARLET